MSENGRPEWAAAICEDRDLETIRHQLNHIRDWENGLCECVPRGDEEQLQTEYHKLTGKYWDTYWAENTDRAPRTHRVSESEALSELMHPPFDD